VTDRKKGFGLFSYEYSIDGGKEKKKRKKEEEFTLLI